MPMIIQRGRNPIVAAAFAGLRAAERKEKKGARPADAQADHQRAVDKVKKTLRKALVSPDQVKVAPKKAPVAKKRASRKAKR